MQFLIKIMKNPGSPVVNLSFPNRIAKSSEKRYQKFQDSKENFCFTPQHLRNIRVIDSAKSTPEDLREIFSPPPGFDNKYVKKLDFTINEFEIPEEDPEEIKIKLVKICEKCENISTFPNSSHIFSDFLNVLQNLKNLKKTYANQKNDISYIKELQRYIRDDSLIRVKEKIELQKNHDSEIKLLKGQLNSLSNFLSQDLNEKDKIIENLIRKVKEYDPDFAYPQHFKECGPCAKYLKTIEANEIQIKELQTYIRNWPCPSPPIFQNFDPDQYKATRLLIHSKVISLESSLNALPNLSEKTILLSKFTSLVYPLKSIFSICRKMEFFLLSNGLT